MRNFCQIFSKKTKKISTFVLVLCLIYGLTPTAEGISTKLKGKIALGVILSGVAYTTHTLIKRDRQTAAELRHHLGAPERVVQFERGFDSWRIEHYGNRHYIFRNNRLLTKTNFSFSNMPPSSVACRCWQASVVISCRYDFFCKKIFQSSVVFSRQCGFPRKPFSYQYRLWDYQIPLLTGN